MKTPFVLIALCLSYFFGGSLFSQGNYYPIKVKGKWGLINDSAQVVVEPGYDFMEQGKKYWKVWKGDSKGILLPQYPEIQVMDLEEIQAFGSYGVTFRKDSLYAFLHTGNGNYFPPQFTQIYPYPQLSAPPFIFQQQSKTGAEVYGLLSPEGQIAIPPQSQSAPELLPQPTFAFSSDPAAQSYQPLAVIELENGKAIYDIAQQRQVLEGLEEVQQVASAGWIVSRNGLSHWIHAENGIFGGQGYERLEEILPGYLVFQQGPQHGIMDLKGKVQFQSQLALGEALSEDRIATVNSQGKFGMVDLQGRTIYPPRYASITSIGDHSFALEQNSRFGIGDPNGRIGVPVQFSEVKTAYKDDLFRVKNSEGWALLTDQGEHTEIEGMAAIGNFRGPLAIIAQGTARGLANCLGELVIPLAEHKIEIGKKSVRVRGDEIMVRKFDEFGRLFPEKVFTVVSNRKGFSGDLNGPAASWGSSLGWIYLDDRDVYGFIHPDKRDIRIQPKFHDIRVKNDLGLTMTTVRRSGLSFYGLVDHRNGIELIPPRFTWFSFQDFDNGPTARAQVKGGTFVLVNRKGKILPLKDVQWLGEPQDGIAPFNVNGNIRRYLKDPGPWHVGTRKELVPGEKRSRLVNLSLEDGQWGYLDIRTGKIVQEAEFKWAESFNQGKARVLGNNGWGMIDTDFEFTIPPIYHSLDLLTVHGENSLVRAGQRPRLYGFMNVKGDIQIAPRFEKAQGFHEGLAAVRDQGKWGFIDTLGNWVIAPSYDRARNFSGGYTWVWKDRALFILDRQGQATPVPEFAKMGDFHHGYAWASQNNRLGYVDPQGNWIVPAKYLSAEDFQADGRAAVRSKKGWGLVDHRGELVMKAKYPVIEAYAEGRWLVKKGSKVGLIDGRGEWIIPPKYKQIQDHDGQGFFMAQRSPNYAYAFDAQGNLQFELETDRYFGKEESYREGLLLCKSPATNRWGYLDQEGEWHIEAKFQRGWRFSDGFALVKQHGSEQVIDRSGQVLNAETALGHYGGRYMKYIGKAVYGSNYWSHLYCGSAEQQASEFQGIQHSGPFFSVKKGHFWRLYDLHFNQVNGHYYREALQFSEGLAPVEHTGAFGLLDLAGEELVPVAYSEIKRIAQLYQVHEDGKLGYVNADGQWVWPLTE